MLSTKLLTVFPETTDSPFDCKLLTTLVNAVASGNSEVTAATGLNAVSAFAFMDFNIEIFLEYPVKEEVIELWFNTDVGS